MTDRPSALPEVGHGDLPVEGWVVLRLDGRGFTKGAGAYARPFDIRFHEAMTAAAEVLMAETPAVGYHTASDEISLLFAPGTDWFGGRAAKWLSISASVASAVLARRMEQFSGTPSMDARALASPDVAGVLAYLLERAHSSWRNCRQGYVYYGLRSAGMSGGSADRAMRASAPGSLDHMLPADIPAWQRLGRYALYQEVAHTGTDPRTGEERPTVRRRLAHIPVEHIGDLAVLGPLITAAAAGARRR